MNRKQFGQMLADMKRAINENRDPQEVLNGYRQKYKYAYIYSDAIAKTIFGTEAHEKLAIDLLNAIFKLEGDNRIKKLKFSRTERGAEIGVKHTNSDIVADWEGDRIVLEFQHEGDSFFKDRLIYYMARDTIPMLHTGEKYHLKSLYTVSVQLFNEPIYSGDRNYLHSILLKDENGKVFYEKQVLKLVEVAKMALDYEYEMAIQLKREVAEQVAVELPKRVAEQVEKQVAEQVEKQVAEKERNLIARNLREGMTTEAASKIFGVSLADVEAIQKNLASV